MTRPVAFRSPRRLTRLAVLFVLSLAAGLLSVVSVGSAAAATTFTSTVVNQANGNCATVPNSTSAVQLTSAACNSGAGQSFTFTPLAGSSDTYSVGTFTSGSCLDVHGASTSDNAAVIQYACHSGTNQQFRLQPTGTDTFTVVVVSSGKCVGSSGANLVQLPCSASLVWRLPGYNGNPTPQDPPARTVRVWLLRPSDVPFDQRYPDGIANVMREAQRYYQQELGRTFRLADPVVQVVTGEHVKSWYENTPNGPDRYWWSVFNMQQELLRRFNLGAPDSRWLNVGEVIAEGPGAGGGGGNGWVILCQHDADGAAGINGPMNRWYGGMVHELGHAFGLPDSTSTDGTPMSASFYNYPNTHFNQSQKTAILNGPYGTFLS